MSVPEGISLCVPSYQRREKLAALLASVADAVTASAVGGAVEVVVCLDGSTDGSAEMLESARARSPFALSVVRQRNLGRAAARNRALAAARHEIVWLLDDDMRITAETLDAHRRFQAEHDAVLTGPCVVAPSEDPTVAFVRRFYERRHARLARTGRVDDPADFSTANTSARVALLGDEPFDAEFTDYGYEDYELCARLLARGVPIRFDAEAVVTHDFERDRAAQLAVERGTAINAVRFLQKHPRLGAVVRLGQRQGRLERWLLDFARPPASAPLWWIARALHRASGHGKGPIRGRLWACACVLARLSGLARADGCRVVRETRRRLGR